MALEKYSLCTEKREILKGVRDFPFLWVCLTFWTLIVELSELEEGKEKPAAEKRKIGCNEKRDSWEQKERIGREEQKQLQDLRQKNTPKN